MSTQQAISALCPNCNAQTTAAVRDIIDGQDLAAKTAFLQGRLNSLACSQCSSAIPITIPLLYYDLHNELALMLLPSELNLSDTAQQETQSALTDRLLNGLPSEQHRDYLRNPTVFSSHERMADAILEEGGLAPATLQTQMRKAILIEELLQSPDEATLKAKAAAHDAELDYDFFEVLTIFMQAAHTQGDQVKAQTYLTVRTLLGQWSSQGKSALAAIDAKFGLLTVQSRKDLLEKLQGAMNSEERMALVVTGYVFLDEVFFQHFKTKIDQAIANGKIETARQLQDLYPKVLRLKAKQDKKHQAALARANDLFRDVVQSDQPEQVLRQKIQQIDESFFVVLGANIERARRQGQHEPARALEMIGQLATSLLQERRSSKPAAG
jgi:hypothetical protein